MAKWRCEVDIAFNDEKDAVSFLNLLRDIQTKLYAGSGSEKIPIIATCRYHECFHDETPPKQCGNYVNFDLKRPIVEPVKKKDGTVVSADELLKKGA